MRQPSGHHRETRKDKGKARFLPQPQRCQARVPIRGGKVRKSRQCKRARSPHDPDKQYCSIHCAKYRRTIGKGRQELVRMMGPDRVGMINCSEAVPLIIITKRCGECEVENRCRYRRNDGDQCAGLFAPDAKLHDEEDVWVIYQILVNRLVKLLNVELVMYEVARGNTIERVDLVFRRLQAMLKDYRESRKDTLARFIEEEIKRFGRKASAIDLPALPSSIREDVGRKHVQTRSNNPAQKIDLGNGPGARESDYSLLTSEQLQGLVDSTMSRIEGLRGELEGFDRREETTNPDRPS